MQKLVFILLMLTASSAYAQNMPPKCWEPYQYVNQYGQWSLNNGVWSLPFTCTSGISAAIKVNQENVANLGLAEYYVQAKGIDDNNTFFFTEPCGAMGLFCRYVVLPQEEGMGQIYSLDQ